ncbi:hypothetical protein GOP47_0014688 [Adiantum capillus-veneris]|uniref:Uncharacterized protein n=1 Tax=Adiantum capillus-veneris TaxID=13818 RepID=A0A9D4ZEF7_ADICA|nr:hypothetical protein GOP47_0014688 [Adiantum capillus-veneris]
MMLGVCQKMKMQFGLSHQLSSSFVSSRASSADLCFFPKSSTTTAYCSSSAFPILNKLNGALKSPLFQSYGPLVGSFLPVGVAILGCKILSMGAEKELALAVSRSSVQLAILAFVLKFVFEGERVTSLILAVSFMVLVAGWTAGDRVRTLPKSHLIATSALAFGTLSVLGVMTFLQASPITPRYIIPTTGYIIGNSMSMVGATMQGLRKDIAHHRGQVEAALALGATPRQAVQSYIRRAVTQGMAPWIDSIKTAGLITIPGSMTGMLMLNMRPMEVVRIQVQLLYMLLGAAALSSAISSLLAYRALFNDNFQLEVAEA